MLRYLYSGSELRDITGYEGYYKISACGEVYSNRYGFLKPLLVKNTGYFQVSLNKRGIRKRVSIHRLVAIEFIHNLGNKPNINHKDGNKINNRVENLEWCTQKENIAHSIATGLTNQIGERNNCSKLKDQEVLSIRALAGIHSQNELARMFNISRSVIKDIINQRTWKHLVEN